MSTSFFLGRCCLSSSSVWAVNRRVPIATLLRYLSVLALCLPSRPAVATEMVMFAVHQDSQVQDPQCHRGGSSPRVSEDLFGTLSILTPSPNSVSPHLCWMKHLDISCGVSALDNTLIRERV